MTSAKKISAKDLKAWRSLRLFGVEEGVAALRKSGLGHPDLWAVQRLFVARGAPVSLHEFEKALALMTPAPFMDGFFDAYEAQMEER